MATETKEYKDGFNILVKTLRTIVKDIESGPIDLSILCQKAKNALVDVYRPSGKKLNLVLAYKWYDKIESGKKNKEYREIKNYWNNRLIRPEGFYESVRFQRGYKKNPPVMEFEIKSIYTSDEPNDLGLDKVWVIELGRRLN